MNKKERKLYILLFILLVCSILLECLSIIFANHISDSFILLMHGSSMLSSIISSILVIYYFYQFRYMRQNLKHIKQYCQSLKSIRDDEKAFKHDFCNIMQAMGGYISNNDMDGLRTYYYQLFNDCQKTNTLYSLTPEIVNEPAIYSILLSKYYKANDLGITINLNVLLNLTEINMKIYELTRILGILLDNAIEAASECNEKIINIEFRKDNFRNRKLLIVENTYLEKNIDTERIFEKGFSSKPGNTGMGLWEVRQILKKNKNLNLYTNKDKKYFKQQLEIYDTAKKKNA
ncbi:MAG: GHKL domain-containing protein [Clostridia bacterium]|nr:GHKL domain-containing protein [Clostridia bacterium]